MNALPPTGTQIDGASLDVLMPMHVIVGADARLRQVGPTMRLLRPDAAWDGEAFGDVFTVRRPRNFSGTPQLGEIAHGTTLHVQLEGAAKTTMRGVLAHLPGGEALINFGFGIGVIDAVRSYGLSARDFAPTDLTVEMLYLVEAKSAAMRESRDLNRRLQMAKRAAEMQAKTDPLTGVRNRRALEKEVQELLSESVPFGMMHIDLDYFKEVNDTMGHAAGDHVLKTIAEILVDQVRSSDIIARVGGDEFIIVLPDMTTKAGNEAMARRIIERISEPIMYDGTACAVAASIGSTRTSLYDAPTMEEMSRDSDTALYFSKRAGRGRHTCASDVLDARIGRRATDVQEAD